eukprot:gene9946-2267_t
MNQELIQNVKNWIISKSEEKIITSLEDLTFQLSPICSYKKTIDHEIVYYELIKRNIIHLIDEEKVKYSQKCIFKQETLEAQQIIKKLNDEILKSKEQNNYLHAAIKKVRLWFTTSNSLPKTSVKLKRAIKQFCTFTISVNPSELVNELMKRKILFVEQGEIHCSDEMEQEEIEDEFSLKRKSPSWFYFQNCKKNKQ